MIQVLLYLLHLISRPDLTFVKIIFSPIDLQIGFISLIQVGFQWFILKVPKLQTDPTAVFTSISNKQYVSSGPRSTYKNEKANWPLFQNIQAYNCV
jgi:hypothetical protein